jgi:hypothetical protein
MLSLLGRSTDKYSMFSEILRGNRVFFLCGRSQTCDLLNNKPLEKYGIVELKKIKGKITHKVKAIDFRVELRLHYSFPSP